MTARRIAQLLVRHPAKSSRREAPAQIDAPAHHAGVAARRVEEDAIERYPAALADSRVPLSSRAGTVDAMVTPRRSRLSRKTSNALRIAIAGERAPAILHQLGEQTALAARRGAGVEDRFARLRIEQFARDDRCSDPECNTRRARARRSGMSAQAHEVCPLRHDRSVVRMMSRRTPRAEIFS